MPDALDLAIHDDIIYEILRENESITIEPLPEHIRQALDVDAMTSYMKQHFAEQRQEFRNALDADEIEMLNRHTLRD